MPSVYSNDIPKGTIQALGSSGTPEGWLLCDGSSVSRTTYANLFATIGTAFGSASGTTFNLPDLRGRFLRGWANGNTRDPDRAGRTAMATGGNTGDAVGSVQGHAFQTHSHTNSYTNNQVASGLAGLTSGQAAYDRGNGGSSQNTQHLTITINNATASGANAQASANESRPVNAYVNYIIRY